MNRSEVIIALHRYLTQQGTASAPELCKQLNISQPVFSRLTSSLGGELLRVGKARKIRYALRRSLIGTVDGIPIYRIQEDGSSLLLGNLHGIHPKGFYLEQKHATIQSRFYADLPYWFEDLRPAGYLGRTLPQRHAVELGTPNDIRLWSVENCLRYWERYGWNLVGNLIFGDEAFRLYLDYARSPPDVVLHQDREARYPQLANEAQTQGVPGSSAGGEQPKFLATRQDQGEPRSSLTSVLVKFSPPITNPISQRLADLLVCEHLVLKTLRQKGILASQSALLRGERRTFLEVERFDRVQARGRRGVISLRALDAEFVGSLESWSKTSRRLLELKRINSKTCEEIERLEIFGHFIGNTDMHLGNLSFYGEGERLLGLCPVYDMLPMLYAPVEQQLLERKLAPPYPTPSNATIWRDAWNAACEFWSQAARDQRISDEFRAICAANLKQLSALGDILRLLPQK